MHRSRSRSPQEWISHAYASPRRAEAVNDARVVVHNFPLLQSITRNYMKPNLLLHVGEALVFHHENPEDCPVDLGELDNCYPWMWYVFGMALAWDGAASVPDDVYEFLMDCWRIGSDIDDITESAERLMCDNETNFRKMLMQSLHHMNLFLRNLCLVIRHLGWPGGDL